MSLRLQQLVRGPPGPSPAPPLQHLPRTGGAPEKWKLIEQQGMEGKAELYNAEDAKKEEAYKKNIENYIGTVKVPVGISGPLRIRQGSFARGDFYVPLATTEAALVASVSRGMRAILEAGGCETLYIDEGVQRVPVFEFSSLQDLHAFRVWLSAPEQRAALELIVGQVTRHGKLIDWQYLIEGNRLQIRFDFSTGDASGQNMVTFITNKILAHIRQHSPVKLVDSIIEGGGSSDKKASHLSLSTVRGRRVTAQVLLPEKLVRSLLHTSPQAMQRYRTRNAMIHHMIGVVGTSSHPSNVLTAIFIATGQDAACAAESHVAYTRMEVTAEGALYASITLPAVLCATVGGGTGLPSQNAALSLMRVKDARQLAEVIAGAALAGELSITAAFVSEEFTSAHYNLSRGIPQAPSVAKL